MLSLKHKQINSKKMKIQKRELFYGRIFTTISLLVFGFALGKLFKKLQIIKKLFYQKSSDSKEECPKFYTINDPSLIKLILNETKIQNGNIISQLIQPYLLIDSKCRYKITKHEYVSLINVFILKCYENTRQTFVDTIVASELKQFLDEKKCEKESQNINFFDINEVFELTFKIGTTYLKNTFKNSQKNENYQINSFDKNIFIQLMRIQENFTLNLFLSPRGRLIRRYSKNLKNLMKLIEIEYKECLDDCPVNVKFLKFLFIKNFYLDILVIFSVVSNFLHEILTNDSICEFNLINEINSSRNLFLKSNEIWKYSHLKESITYFYIKYLARDLLRIDRDFSIVSNTSTSIHFNKTDLVGLNLKFSKIFKNNYKMYAEAFDINNFYLDSNNLTLNLTYSIVFFLLRNFNLKNFIIYKDDHKKKSMNFKIISVYKNIRIKH